MTHRNDSRKHYSYDYSFVITNIYRLEPAEKTDKQGKIWECSRAEASDVLRDITLMALLHDNMHSIDNQGNFPKL